jgi:MFS family permease
VDPDRSGVRPALVLGSITFVLFLFVVWLMPDPGCRAGFCGAANTLLLVTLLGQPVVATVVASVRAGRASLRVSIGARAVIAASISLGLVGGLLLGEVLRGISGASVTLLLTVPLAAMLLWPVPFVVATVTVDHRRARDHGPAPNPSTSARRHVSRRPYHGRS